MSDKPRRAYLDNDSPSPDTDRSFTQSPDESLTETNTRGIPVDATAYRELGETQPVAYRELGETQPMSHTETLDALGLRSQPNDDDQQGTRLRPAVSVAGNSGAGNPRPGAPGIARAASTEFDPDADDDQLDTIDEPKSRPSRGRVILISALALVMVIGLFLVGRNLFGPADQGIKADRMVVEYLETVATGDTAGALKFSPNSPPDSRLLTPEVLHESINRAPITDIKVVASNNSQVEVNYNLGGTPVTGIFDVTKQNGRWILPQAWATLEVTENDLNMPFLINNAPVDGPGQYPIFPGSYLVSPRTDTVSIDHRFNVYDNAPDQPLGTVQLELTDAGKRDAVVQIRNQLQRCVDSQELKPVNCPYAIPDETKGGQKIIPNSVRIQLVNDPLDGVEVQTQPGTPVATADMKIEFTIQGKVRDNGATLDLGTQTEVVNATAIVSYDQDPPSVGWTVAR